MMKQSDFLALCLERFIDPAVALESEAVRAAIVANDLAALAAALDSEF